VMIIFFPLPKGRRNRGQSILHVFREILFPSYKPHPLVGGAVDGICQKQMLDIKLHQKQGKS
jgi:hypothetical protein